MRVSLSATQRAEGVPGPASPPERASPPLACSCSVWQPAARTFVAATSSDATIALAAYDFGGCVPGLALARGALLQVSLCGGPAQRFLALLPDVRKLLAYEPGCTHILCVPFGNGPAGHWDRLACGHRRAAGALLLGLAAPPEVTPGSLALLSGLGDALSAALAQQAAEVAALAEYACGTWETRCTCPDDGGDSSDDDDDGSGGGGGGGEEDEEEAEGDSSRAAPCREDDAGGSGDSAPGGWANVIPTTEQAPYARPSGQEQHGPLGKGHHPAAQWKQQPQRSTPSAPPSVHHAAKLAALPDSAGLAADPLWLGFREPGVEAQFRSWSRQQRAVVEVFACLFTLLSTLVAGWGEPYRLAARAPAGVALAAGLCLLILFSASPHGRRALPPGARPLHWAVMYPPSFVCVLQASWRRAPSTPSQQLSLSSHRPRPLRPLQARARPWLPRCRSWRRCCSSTRGRRPLPRAPPRWTGTAGWRSGWPAGRTPSWSPPWASRCEEGVLALQLWGLQGTQACERSQPAPLKS